MFTIWADKLPTLKSELSAPFIPAKVNKLDVSCLSVFTTVETGLFSQSMTYDNVNREYLIWDRREWVENI